MGGAAAVLLALGACQSEPGDARIGNGDGAPRVGQARAAAIFGNDHRILSTNAGAE
ncbi:MAG: hypothetical protein AAGA56_17850 [Myxococcota bacterium]